MDADSPNIPDQRQKHIKKQTFLGLVRQQFAANHVGDAQCAPMYVRGARRALFKDLLWSYGYTAVAKGMEEHNFRHLQHEEEVYGHLEPLHGTLSKCV